MLQIGPKELGIRPQASQESAVLAATQEAQAPATESKFKLSVDADNGEKRFVFAGSNTETSMSGQPVVNEAAPAQQPAEAVGTVASADNTTVDKGLQFVAEATAGPVAGAVKSPDGTALAGTLGMEAAVTKPEATDAVPQSNGSEIPANFNPAINLEHWSQKALTSDEQAEFSQMGLDFENTSSDPMKIRRFAELSNRITSTARAEMWKARARDMQEQAQPKPDASSAPTSPDKISTPLKSAVEKFGQSQEPGITAKPEYSTTGNEKQQFNQALEARGWKAEQRLNAKGELTTKIFDAKGVRVSEDQFRSQDPIFAEQYDRLVAVAEKGMQNSESRRATMREINGPSLADRAKDGMKWLWGKVTTEAGKNWNGAVELVRQAGESYRAAQAERAAQQESAKEAAKLRLEAVQEQMAKQTVLADARENNRRIDRVDMMDRSWQTSRDLWRAPRVEVNTRFVNSAKEWLSSDPFTIRERTQEIRIEMANVTADLKGLNEAIEQLATDLDAKGVMKKEFKHIAAYREKEREVRKLQKRLSSLQGRNAVTSKLMNGMQAAEQALSNKLAKAQEEYKQSFTPAAVERTMPYLNPDDELRGKDPQPSRPVTPVASVGRPAPVMHETSQAAA